MNVFTFTANLGADAEVKHVSDSTVTEFPAAVNSGYGDKKKTTWHRCSYWGKRGEAVAPYLKKGSQVVISGEHTIREYERKEGGKGFSSEVRVNELTLVGSKRDAPSNPAPQQDNFDDDDIPF